MLFESFSYGLEITCKATLHFSESSFFSLAFSHFGSLHHMKLVVLPCHGFDFSSNLPSIPNLLKACQLWFACWQFTSYCQRESCTSLKQDTHSLT